MILKTQHHRYRGGGQFMEWTQLKLPRGSYAGGREVTCHRIKSPVAYSPPRRCKCVGKVAVSNIVCSVRVAPPTSPPVEQSPCSSAGPLETNTTFSTAFFSDFGPQNGYFSWRLSCQRGYRSTKKAEVEHGSNDRKFKCSWKWDVRRS